MSEEKLETEIEESENEVLEEKPEIKIRKKITIEELENAGITVPEILRAKQGDLDWDFLIKIANVMIISDEKITKQTDLALLSEVLKELGMDFL